MDEILTFVDVRQNVDVSFLIDNLFMSRAGATDVRCSSLVLHGASVPTEDVTAMSLKGSTTGAATKKRSSEQVLRREVKQGG